MYQTDSAPVTKMPMVDTRAAITSPSSQPNSLMHSAPSQNASGPSSAAGRPAMFGSSQSFRLPCAMVHMMPKLPASSFHGSRPIRPGRMYSRPRPKMAQRGKARVAAAERRTGFIDNIGGGHSPEFG